MTGSLVTRFAPSPTGFLHLGHLAHLIFVFGWARQHQARVLLRLEDHDQGRYRDHFRDAIIEDVTSFGFTSAGLDEYSVQSDHFERYSHFAYTLYEQGLVYGCDCSRKEVLARTGHATGELLYDGHCRHRGLPFAGPHGLRMRLPEDDVTFTDQLLGTITQTPSGQCGDVLIRDRSGHWTYQFAVVRDDIDEGVTWVIRGEDLLASTGRQILMRRQWRDDTPIRWTHHPLLTDDGGKKLAKRDLSTSLRDHLASSYTKEQLLGDAACAVGLQSAATPLSLEEAFDLVPHITVE